MIKLDNWRWDLYSMLLLVFSYRLWDLVRIELDICRWDLFSLVVVFSYLSVLVRVLCWCLREGPRSHPRVLGPGPPTRVPRECPQLGGG